MVAQVLSDALDSLGAKYLTEFQPALFDLTNLEELNLSHQTFQLMWTFDSAKRLRQEGPDTPSVCV